MFQELKLLHSFCACGACAVVYEPLCFRACRFFFNSSQIGAKQFFSQGSIVQGGFVFGTKKYKPHNYVSSFLSQCTKQSTTTTRRYYIGGNERVSQLCCCAATSISFRRDRPSSLLWVAICDISLHVLQYSPQSDKQVGEEKNNERRRGGRSNMKLSIMWEQV